MAAVASADIARVRALLSSQQTTEQRIALVNFSDYDQRRPLHIACANGFVAIAKELLRAGADHSARDRFGVSAVRDAIRNGRVETLRVLGECSASFPGKVQATHIDPRYVLGRDLIHVAGEGNVRAASQLVRCFAPNVNFANADGRTALHIAAVREDGDMVRLLLDAGADVERVDRWGVSPVEEARRAGSCELVELMERHGAAIAAAGPVGAGSGLVAGGVGEKGELFTVY